MELFSTQSYLYSSYGIPKAKDAVSKQKESSLHNTGLTGFDSEVVGR